MKSPSLYLWTSSKKREGDITQMSHTFEFNDFNRKVLLAYAENLEIAKNGFFGLCVTVNTHTEKVALILPIQPTLKGKSGPMVEIDDTFAYILPLRH